MPFFGKFIFIGQDFSIMACNVFTIISYFLAALNLLLEGSLSSKCPDEVNISMVILDFLIITPHLIIILLIWTVSEFFHPLLGIIQARCCLQTIKKKIPVEDFEVFKQAWLSHHHKLRKHRKLLTA